jgi:hypothetical protein
MAERFIEPLILLTGNLPCKRIQSGPVSPGENYRAQLILFAVYRSHGTAPCIEGSVLAIAWNYRMTLTYEVSFEIMTRT